MKTHNLAMVLLDLNLMFAPVQSTTDLYITSKIHEQFSSTHEYLWSVQVTNNHYTH